MYLLIIYVMVDIVCININIIGILNLLKKDNIDGYIFW